MFENEKSFIGKGLSFPFRTNARGGIRLVTGSEDIEQSIKIILGTRQGERVMRPTFGSRVHELIFEPRDGSTMSLLQDYVHEALRMWEPRIEVVQVDVSINGSSGNLLAKINYLIKATHDTRSIVYPFFIDSEEESI